MIKIEDQVINLIATHFKLTKKIDVDAHFIYDLCVDSIDIIEFILTCESIFNITITDEEAKTILTPRQAISYIKENI